MTKYQKVFHRKTKSLSIASPRPVVTFRDEIAEDPSKTSFFIT
jgi:hypothetical protein